MTHMLSAREEAMVIWIVIAILAAAIKVPSARLPFLSFIRLALTPPLVVVIAISIAYAATEAGLLREGGVWYPEAPKDVAIWYLAVGIGLMGRAGTSGEDEHVVRALRDAVGLTAIMEFVVNFYVFPLLVELVLVPLLALVVMLQVVSDETAELAPAKKILDGTAATIGIALLSYALIRGAGNRSSLLTAETVDAFILPVFLTLAYFPFVHSVAVYSRYDRRRRMQQWRTSE